MWLAAIGPLLLAATLEVAADTPASGAAASTTAAHGHHHQQQQQVSGGNVGLAAPQSWIPYRHSALSLQGVQSVLLSIEERLRNLDASLYSPRYAPRWEMSLEQQGRRLEAVEARLGRLETLIEIRLDKLSESVSSRQLKEELSKDQMSRKFDSAYERLNHRLGYMEARLDVGVSKLQSSVEMASERVEAAVRGRQGGATTDAAILDLSANVADLRRRVDDCHARSNDTVAAMASTSVHRLDDIATSLAQLRYDFNRTLASASTTELNDASDQASSGAPAFDSSDLVEKVVVAVEKQVSTLANKVTNMYNELWRRTQVLEALTKDSMTLSNATRRELQDGLRSLSRRGAFHADRDKQDTVGSLQESMDVLAGIVHRRMSELGRKLDSSFQMLMLAQNLFLESCHRLQLDEPQLEAKLTEALERILDTLHNKSASTMQEVQDMHEMLKSHHSHLVRTVAHNTNTVMKAAEEARSQAKQIERAIQEVTEALSAAGKDHAATLRQGHDAVDARLANIMGALQDLQDQLGEMASDNSDNSREIMNTEACLNNEKTLTRIAADVEKNNALLLTSFENKTPISTCPSINVSEITNRIASAFKEKDLMVCNAIDDSNNNLIQILRPFPKSYVADKNVFTQSSNDHDGGGNSNDIPREPDRIWDTTKQALLSTSYGRNLPLTSNNESFASSQSKINDINKASSTPSERLVNTERNTTTLETSTSENSVLGVEESQDNSTESKWQNILAVIHDTDIGGSRYVQKPSVTVVHHAKTSEEDNDFSHSLHIPDAVHDQYTTNTTLLTKTPTEQQIQVIALLRKSTDDETLERENGSVLTRRSMNYSNDVMIGNLTLPAKSEQSDGVNKNSESLTISGNKINTKPDHETYTDFGLGNKAENNTITDTIIHAANNTISVEPGGGSGKNYTGNDPNAVVQDLNTEMQISEFLNKIMETYGTDKQVNKSVQDFWKMLLQKNHHQQSGKLSTDNITSTENLATSKEAENESNISDSDYPDYKDTDFSADNLNISAMPETIKDVKIKQYVSKLEELAHELSSRRETSQHNNTVSGTNHTNIYADHQYLSAELTQEDDLPSYQ